MVRQYEGLQTIGLGIIADNRFSYNTTSYIDRKADSTRCARHKRKWNKESHLLS